VIHPKEITMNTVAYFRSLTTKQQNCLDAMSRKVGTGPAREFLAYQAGKEAQFLPHERAQLNEILIECNVRFPRELTTEET